MKFKNNQNFLKKKLKLHSRNKLKINKTLEKNKEFKYNININLKDESYLKNIKKEAKYENYVLKESYTQKIILRNQLLILIEKLCMIKDILNWKIIFDKNFEKYHKKFINEIILLIKIKYNILNKLFKESFLKINKIVDFKSPINQDTPIFYEFNSISLGLEYIKKIFLKVFHFFKDCIIAFFLVCSEKKEKFFDNIEMFNLINILDHIRFKISQFIEFYKINIGIISIPNKSIIRTYNTKRLNKFNFLIKPKKDKIVMSSRINLNKETKKRINNFNKDFKIKNSINFSKTKIKKDIEKIKKLNLKNNKSLNNLKNYLKINSTKIIPKHYQKLLKI